MNPFEHFERKVVGLLLEGHLEPEQIGEVLDSAELVSYEVTGVGYFLTVQHSRLPAQRIVCGEPLLVGSADDVDCGFVVFLENGQLTLECHSWGDSSIPDDFRERQVEVKRAP
jgi:hypothetical protein